MLSKNISENKMEYFAYSQKAFLYKYVVTLSDSDQFKHMSFANYLKLMFLASDALLFPCTTGSFLNQYRFRNKHSRMQFKKQTVPGDNIIIKINGTLLEEKEFTLLHTFVIENSGDLVALGRQTYEVINQATDSLEKLPENLNGILATIEVREENLIYKY